MAVGGVLLLCVLALVVTLADYTSHGPAEVAHVPPVVAAPISDTGSQAPAPVPTIPVTSVTVTPDAPTPPPAGPQPARAEVTQLTLAQLLQQFEQRRHHHGPGA